MLDIRLNTAPIRKQLLDDLRQAIVEGKLKPGQRLRESELSAAAGVSRTVVREALRQLEAEELITARRNKGAVVRALTLEEAKDIYHIRAFLEGLAARLFTERATETDIKQLSLAMEDLLAAYGAREARTILAKRDAFYDVLLAGVYSDVLASMLSALNARIAQWRAIPLSHPGRSKKRNSEVRHELKALLQAIKSGNARAAETAAREHVNGIAAEVVRLFQAEHLGENR
jgi:GntR family transcriptional regulator, trigonelline degradation regulator